MSEAVAKLMRDPALFRQALLVDVGGRPRRLGELLDDWQRRDFAALDPGWLTVCGLAPPAGRPVKLRSWIERPRGHSKTSDEATMIVWALFASQRPITGVVAAADSDQARLVKDAIEQLVRGNPWLGQLVAGPDGRQRPLIDVQTTVIRNTITGSRCDILSNDAPTSYGLRPDFVLADELTHWGKRDLWDSLLSSAAKRRNCLLVAILNAGWSNTWQWELREAVRVDPDWYFSRLEEPRASWIRPEALAEQRRLLPSSAFNRLWLNQWQAAEGDAIPPRDIEAATVLSGPLRQRLASTDLVYLAGLDLGLRRDHSAVVVLGIDARHREIRLACCDSWNPRDYGGDLPIELIEQHIHGLNRRFGLSGIVYDPWQAEYLAQRLRHHGLHMIPWTFSAANLDLMARSLLTAFRERLLLLYRDEALIRDLQRLTIVERVQGFRITALRDEHGHADRASALCCALPVALQWLDEIPAVQSGDAGPMFITV